MGRQGRLRPSRPGMGARLRARRVHLRRHLLRRRARTSRSRSARSSGYDITQGPGGSLRRPPVAPPAPSSSPAARPITIWREWNTRVGAWDQRGTGLGGWSLSSHHVYDPDTRVLLRGDGITQSADAVAYNGISLFAGFNGAGQQAGYNGDEIPAVGAKLAAPQDLAAAPDGSLYIADLGNGRVRRVDPEGTIHTIYHHAGTPRRRRDRFKRRRPDRGLRPQRDRRRLSRRGRARDRRVRRPGRGRRRRGRSGDGRQAQPPGPDRRGARRQRLLPRAGPDHARAADRAGRDADDRRGRRSRAAAGQPARGRASAGREIRLAFVFNSIAVGPDGTLYVVDVDNDGVFIRQLRRRRRRARVRRRHRPRAGARPTATAARRRARSSRASTR